MSLSLISFISGMPGGLEILVIFVAVLILFGPKKLPGISRSIGKTLEQLRRGADEFKDQILNIDDEEPIDVSSEMESELVTKDDVDDYDVDNESINEDHESSDQAMQSDDSDQEKQSLAEDHDDNEKAQKDNQEEVNKDGVS